MEAPSPSGRPPKDPEKRRSETVHIRLCPSCKKLIRMEADRRSTSMTMVVVRVGFEEIQPTGRRVPDPSVWEWLRDLARQLHANAEREEGHYVPTIEMRDLKKDIISKAEQVAEKRQKVDELWEAARRETRDEVLGVRLTPGRYEWLGRRAEEQETGRSSLLRVRALEGLRDRCWIPRVETLLEEWAERTGDIRSKIYKVGGGDEVKSDLNVFALEVDREIARREEKW